MIVTVDCGSTSVAEIAAAQAAGIDVLVTDHHRLPPELPVARRDRQPAARRQPYPERRLAGSGVAFKLAQLLLADEPGGPAAALALADLATIGSIADLVPILGETRAIVRLGLALIAAAPRPGIAALLASASVSPSAVDVETLSFAVAPRINAAGRVGESRAAAALLLTDDRDEADTLAAELEAANRSRRDMTTQAMSEARAVRAARGGNANPAGVPTTPPSARRRRPGPRCPGHDRPRPVAGRDRGSRRLAPRRRPRPAGGRWRGPRARHPGVVPKRRSPRPRRHPRGMRRPVPPPAIARPRST